MKLEKEKDNEKSEDNINKEETEELLKIEARDASNKICLKCSRFIDINNVQYTIFKYLGRYTILKNH